MSFDANRLYELLPGVHRERDFELGREWARESGEWAGPGDSDFQQKNHAASLRHRPLRQLVEVLADQIAVLEEHLSQLGENHFVETAAAWALPYLADLVGLEGLSQSRGLVRAPRAEVGHTIAYRRRKGTAAMLELLARDVSGWPARAVEYFEKLAATQNVNHVRLRKGGWASLRHAAALEETGSPFEPHTRTVEVRRIAPRRGRWNIPNIGLHVWRIQAHSLTLSPLVEALIGSPPALSPLHRHFHPLRLNQSLFNRPVTEEDTAQLASRLNVPSPITPRLLAGPEAAPGQFHPSVDYYGNGGSASILLFRQMPNGAMSEVPPTDVLVADLTDRKNPAGDVIAWSRQSAAAHYGKILLDPSRGRVVTPPGERPLFATFHYGTPGPVGGGEYDRSRSLSRSSHPSVAVSTQSGSLTLQDAIVQALADAPQQKGEASIEIVDSSRYVVTLPPLDLGNVRLEIRAADQCRPTIVLGATWEVKGSSSAALILNGLVLSPAGSGAPALRLDKSQAPGRLQLRHCSLLAANSPALAVESDSVAIELENCFTGALKIGSRSVLKAKNCLIDGGAEDTVAVDGFGLGDSGFGPIATFRECTIFGQVRVSALPLASNSIFASRVASPAPAEWPVAVMVQRRQEGCVRFSFLPRNSRSPQRHECLPSPSAPNLWPVFTSVSYGDPAYGQLSALGPPEIRRRADDESEPGVWHDLFQPHREDYLARRLAEYLRFGLEAGVFLQS